MPSPPPTAYADRLRDVGLRVTRPRLAVLAAVEAQPHADTASILGRVRDDLERVSHQAVYDVLEALTRTGVVRRIQPAGSLARYELRVGDNHHHAVCRSCGDVTDVDCAVGETPCLTPGDHAGFVIDEAEVVYWGRCADCATVRADGTDEAARADGTDEAARADGTDEAARADDADDADDSA